MPTASSFRAAATRLRSAADDCAAVTDRMWSVGEHHGINGGRLERLVDTALVANALSAQTLRQQCDELADLCLERAAVCDEYARQLANWNSAVDAWEDRRDTWLRQPEGLRGRYGPGQPPRPLEDPPDWVEVE